MPIYTRKFPTVEARQYFGPNLNITSFKAGDQTTKSGDFLVVDPSAVATLREQEKATGQPAGSLGNKGVIYVVSKADFFKEFNALDETVVPVLKGDDSFNFETLSAPAASAPAV